MKKDGILICAKALLCTTVLAICGRSETAPSEAALTPAHYHGPIPNSYNNLTLQTQILASHRTELGITLMQNVSLRKRAQDSYKVSPLLRWLIDHSSVPLLLLNNFTLQTQIATSKPPLLHQTLKIYSSCAKNAHATSCLGLIIISFSVLTTA